MPEFTVLIAVYRGDSAVLFRRALDSIAANSIQPKCTVLVIDGPIPDAIEDVIADFGARCPLKVARLPQQGGLAAALNAGLVEVQTEWVVRADADDFNLANRFAVLANAMSDGCDLIGSFVREMDPATGKAVVRSVPLSHREIVSFALRRNPFNHMSVAFRTQVVRDVGGYPSLHLREDYGLWIHLLAGGAIAKNIPLVLVEAAAGSEMYRRRGGWRYSLHELHLQRLLVEKLEKAKIVAFIEGAARAVIFLSPSFVRAFVYRTFLRVSHP